MDRAGPLTPATRDSEPVPATASAPAPATVGPERARGSYLLTSEPDRVDLDQVHAWLSKESYWATGRPRDAVERSIAGSRPYCVYAGDDQVGFARVVTDGVTFAWICDVFIDAAHRGRGLGSWLVEAIVEDISLHGGPRFLLTTKDAHDLYRRCGFLPLHSADRWMELDKRPTRPAGD